MIRMIKVQIMARMAIMKENKTRLKETSKIIAIVITTRITIITTIIAFISRITPITIIERGLTIPS